MGDDRVQLWLAPRLLGVRVMVSFARGFRFSILDAVVLSVSGLIGSATWHEPAELGRPLLFVVAHFFLFCNIARVRLWRELLWSLGFLLNLGVYVSFNALEHPIDWFTVSVTTLPITVAVVLSEVTSASYRGVFASTLHAAEPHRVASRSAMVDHPEGEATGGADGASTE